MHITALRMKAQQITRPTFTRPAEVVAWMGAVQAQDYTAHAGRWASASPAAASPRPTSTRAWPTAKSCACTPCAAPGSSSRRRTLAGWSSWWPDGCWPALPGATRSSASTGRLSAKACGPWKRPSCARGSSPGPRSPARCERAGFTTSGERLSHLLGRAELEGLICSGGRNGKHRTFALLDVRAPGPTRRLARDEALAELARRYFRSRGPATLDDFVWWSGLTVGDARAGLESVRSELVSVVSEGRTYWLAEGPAARPSRNAAHLLPFFDEYIVGYRNRQAAVDPKYNKRLNSGGGMLNPSAILDGQMIGTWRRTLTPDRVKVELSLFQPLDPRQQPPLRAAAARYASFLGLPLDLTIRRSGPAPRPRRSPTRAVAVHLS